MGNHPTALTLRESARVQESYGLYFPTFGRGQSKCGKIRTRKTPNTNTFHAELSG